MTYMRKHYKIMVFCTILILLTYYSIDSLISLKELNTSKTFDSLKEDQLFKDLKKMDYYWHYIISRESKYFVNAESMQLKRILVDPRFKEFHTHLFPLAGMPWYEIFSDESLISKFEIIYVNGQGYFPRKVLPNLGAVTFFTFWTVENMRLFIFMNLIDPIGTQVYCLKYCGISLVQYQYVVTTESFVNASELFLKNNLEVIKIAKEFFDNKDNFGKAVLAELGMLHMQGLPVLELSKLGFKINYSI